MFGPMKSLLERWFTRPIPLTLTLELVSRTKAYKSRAIRMHHIVVTDAMNHVRTVRQPMDLI